MSTILIIDDDEHYKRKKYTAPLKCPSCNSELKLKDSEVILYCDNPYCPAKTCARIEYWVSKEAMDIENIGPAVIEQLYNKCLVKSPIDLYKLTVENFLTLDGIQQKSAESMYNTIQKSTTQTLARLITALSVRNVGKENASILADEFETLDNLMNANIDEISKVQGIGAVIAQEVYDFFHNPQNISFIDEVKKFIKPQHSQNKTDELKGLTFVLTGTLQSLTRDEASEIIKKMGGKTSSSVSKNTSYVIAGENAGSKLDKAQNLNIPILTENDFLSMIKVQAVL